jgi:two-component system response regulator DevR
MSERHPAASAESSTPPTRVRVLLCDDHELVRGGLKALLESDLTVEVVGEAGSADQAIRFAAEVKPDVVVMDIRMPGRSGIEACREIRAGREETSVLILTSFADDEALFSAIMAGASGYVLKQIKGNDLLDAIHKVASGQSLLDPTVTARVLARIRGDAGPVRNARSSNSSLRARPTGRSGRRFISPRRPSRTT